MKKYIYIIVVMTSLLLGACNDDFLEKYPTDSQTEGTAFNTYENFKTYTWSLYSVFTNNNFVQFVENGLGKYKGDWMAGYLSTYSTTENNTFRNQTAQAPASGGGWNFSFIRKVNLMLDNIDDSKMNEVEKNHWRAVGYFFHSYNYMELISRFGDVPWVDKVIGENDVDLIYGKRSPRKEVSDKVLERLLFAEKNIKKNGDGNNTINVNVIRALISRFGLFEGTWRKYHALGDGDKFLAASILASEELIKSFPTVNDSYDELLCSEDLSKYNGMILYKEYVKDILMNGVGHTERTSSGKYEMHKATVEMYLCSDGKPVSTSDKYDGDKTMYDEFRNRDHRLLYQVVPPFFMTNGVGLDFVPNGSKNNTMYSADVDTEEYVELLKQISPNNTSKRLPVFNWSGTMNWTSPNINGPGQAPMGCRTGYYMWRHYNLWDTNSNMASINTADKPIFYIEEILLNYAEAMFESGKFTQDVANKTINKLRSRVDVAAMDLAQINDGFDPKRDKSVDPILWEIRRERIVELMGDGFGFQDIRRWKKGEWFINQDQMGVYIKQSDYKNKKGELIPAWEAIKLVDRNFKPVTGEGYVKRFINPKDEGKGWKDQYYLFPLPLNDLSLNTNLVQNPDWN